MLLIACATMLAEAVSCIARRHATSTYDALDSVLSWFERLNVHDGFLLILHNTREAARPQFVTLSLSKRDARGFAYDLM